MDGLNRDNEAEHTDDYDIDMQDEKGDDEDDYGDEQDFELDGAKPVNINLTDKATADPEMFQNQEEGYLGQLINGDVFGGDLNNNQEMDDIAGETSDSEGQMSESDLPVDAKVRDDSESDSESDLEAKKKKKE